MPPHGLTESGGPPENDPQPGDPPPGPEPLGRRVVVFGGKLVPAMGVEPIRYKPVDFESTDDSLKMTPKSAFCRNFAVNFV